MEHSNPLLDSLIDGYREAIECCQAYQKVGETTFIRDARIILCAHVEDLISRVAKTGAYHKELGKLESIRLQFQALEQMQSIQPGRNVRGRRL